VRRRQSILHADAARLRAVADEAETLANGFDHSDPHAAVDAILAPLVDPGTIRAMAAERTDLFIEYRPELILLAPDAALRSVWLDAFTLGVLFQQRGGHIGGAMDTELFERLVYNLHEAEQILGDGTHVRESCRFCRECHTRVEYLMPVIEDRMRETSDHDW
jgi:hypothetical protein